MMVQRNKLIIATVLIGILIGVPQVVVAQLSDTTFSIAPIFQNNMVLQQKSMVAMWGKGNPEAIVNINGSWGKSASVKIDSAGNWKVKLQTPEAGGPYEVTIQYNSTVQTFKNVLIGEVWLCSGQSNMEMPLEGWPPNDTIMNSQKEIAESAYPQIRLFQVKNNFAAEPVTEHVGDWEECSPQTVRTFSAVAYLFGKELHQKLNIPIGLIEADWGGTAVESWMSKEALSAFPSYEPILEAIDRSKDSLKILNQWLAQHRMLDVGAKPREERWENLKFDDSECSEKYFNDRDWISMKLPTRWEASSLGDFDGVVWFRKTLQIPAQWIGKSLSLFLGPIDDMDETYVNGILVGKMLKDGFYKIDRTYSVPASLVTDSVLTIAVRVIDTQGGGGIWGDGKIPYLACEGIEEKLLLNDEWLSMPVAEYRGDKFYVLGLKEGGFRERPKLPVSISAYSPTTLYNGMIHPLVPFTIRGTIWYQGEANVSDPQMYQKTFPAMISSWRSVFESGEFPFYFVQIAPSDYGEGTHSEELREAQLLTMLSVKNTGMAVTLDIGNPKNIHPCNKHDVGHRLALWALAQTYRQKVPAYSGPILKTVKKEKNQLKLVFDYAGSGLVLKEKNGNNEFLIAGPDSVFKKAVVKVHGKALLVSHPEIENPVAVRYAWSNTSEATLFNKEGLPASSFRAGVKK